jgi:hypothetical protein
VKGIPDAIMSQKEDSVSLKIFKWNSPNYFENSQLRLSIPANSLYEDASFNYARTNTGNQNIYPYTHYVGDQFVPLFKPAELSFSLESIPEKLRGKIVVASIEDSNKISCISSTLNGDRISARIGKFGKFTLVADTIPPSILPGNITNGAIMSSQISIRFEVKDELSGVSEYQGFIDKEWALFEYDPKNNLIVYTFDKNRLVSGIEHELELYVKDAVGNQKMYHTRFIW